MCFHVRKSTHKHQHLCSMNCEITVVGLVRIEYVSTRGISAFQLYPKADGSYGGSVALKNGWAWKTLAEKFIESDKRIWELTVTSNAGQNDIFDNKVSDIAEKEAFTGFELDDMQRDRFLVRFETQNGEKYLVGTMNQPMRFKQTTNSNRATYALEFLNQQSHKALIFNYQ